MQLRVIAANLKARVALVVHPFPGRLIELCDDRVVLLALLVSEMASACGSA